MGYNKTSINQVNQSLNIQFSWNLDVLWKVSLSDKIFLDKDLVYFLFIWVEAEKIQS
jgi:hypothetical protein